MTSVDLYYFPVTVEYTMNLKLETKIIVDKIL